MQSKNEKILNQLLARPQREQFEQMLKQFRDRPSKIEDWSSIRSPNNSMQVDYRSLDDSSNCGENFSRLVIGKLNGGLGTSMGCSGPKSLIKVRGEKSFLEMIFQQIGELNSNWNSDIPLLLMNSFYTDNEIRKFIHNCDISITSFKQNMFPRLHAETLQPLTPEEFGELAWYPPGHGDFYSCLEQQGILRSLIERGKDILFVSNADNLGAVADPKILNHMIKKKIPFLIEVTPKTPADVKGGTLYEQEGKLRLLEIAQVPKEHIDDFCSQEKFSVFNTNNIWINLIALEERLSEGPLNLNVIANKKLISEKPVLQLETAIGSALDCFDGAVGLCVPRDRFLPVKKTEDLLLVRSNIFDVEGGKLIRNTQRKNLDLPSIKFGSPLNLVDEFEKCFSIIPDLLELESLEVSGQVKFAGMAILKGKVKLNGMTRPILIENLKTIENECIEN